MHSVLRTFCFASGLPLNTSLEEAHLVGDLPNPPFFILKTEKKGFGEIFPRVGLGDNPVAAAIYSVDILT